MDNLAPNYQNIQPTSVEGLDQIFVGMAEALDVARPELAGVQDEGQLVPITEAAERLGITRRSALRLIHEGKLDGAKDGHGQWQVKTSSIQARLCAKSPSDQVIEVLAVEHGPSLDVAGPELAEDQDEGQAEGQPQGPASVDPVLVKELLAKLEALTYRNGYLEAQLEAERQTVKLLTDSQHKPGWWQKFTSWFLGVQ